MVQRGDVDGDGRTNASEMTPSGSPAYPEGASAACDVGMCAQMHAAGAIACSSGVLCDATRVEFATGRYRYTFRWSCGSGYSLNASATTADTFCRDIDECAAATSPCGRGARCVNTPGGFRCDCETGFISDGAGGCVDVNECDDPLTCTAGAGAGTCTNLAGSFSCSCSAGYESSGSGASLTCVDTNECDDPAACGADLGGGVCINTPGAYRCMCNAGFMSSGMGASATCVDVNECAADSNPCGGGMCTNLGGSYECSCPDGYRAPAMGGTCTDIDECMDGSAMCGRNASCINREGAPYECVCVEGYELTDPADPSSDCVPICGDGRVTPDEACDDGNGAAGDGCGPTCEVESGWACTNESDMASVCAETCGDGVIDTGEECDEGEANSDESADACRTNCQRAYCGDGVTDTGEMCDPGGGRATQMMSGACTTACDPGQPDGGVMTDAGVDAGADAAVSADASAGETPSSGGCSLAPPTDEGPGPWFGIGVLAAVMWSRRRQ